MITNLYNVLNKVIDKERLYFYECRLLDFFHDNNIRLKTPLKLIQFGGYNYEYKEDDISYNVEIYEPEYSEDEYIVKYIYIYKTETDISEPYCSALTYYNNDTIKIDIIETPVKCIKINEINKCKSKELITNKYKYGDILMKLIIKFAKERGFKEIILEDRSIFNCLDTNYKLKYSLKNVHILTKGYPWYYKYGFKFIDKEIHNYVKKNNKIIKQTNTKDISFKNFIKLINDEIISRINIDIKDIPMFNEKIMLDIKKIYDKYKNKNICLFFNEFTYKYCGLMSVIHYDLFKYLNLIYINSDNMILKL